MSEKKPPPAPDTPKGGVHSRVDTDSLAERAIDKAHDAKKIAEHADDRSFEALTLGRKHAEMIELLPAMKAQLELALRPTVRPLYVNASYPVVAAALVLLVGWYIARHPTTVTVNSTPTIPIAAIAPPR